MPEINLNIVLNKSKGVLSGALDLSEAINNYYDDYVSATALTLSIGVNPVRGSLVTVRIIGNSLNAFPTNWSSFGDAISTDVNFYNVVTIFYVSSTDIRIVNKLTAAPDVTAPIFTSAPTAANILETSFDVTATLNENGTVYGYLLANGATVPIPQQIIDNAQSTFIDSGSGGTLSYTGLTAVTDYDVYALGVDTAGNRQASGTLVNVQTGSGAFNPASISTQYLWQKLDIATTNADPVTLSTDSLATTSYNFDNIGTVNRAIQNGKECVRSIPANYLKSINTTLSSLFQSTFSIFQQIKLDDGQPAGIGYTFFIDNSSTGRVYIDIRTDGKMTITYSAGGTSVFAQTASSVFANGAFTDFVNLAVVVPSAGIIQIWIDGVQQTLGAGNLSGNMSGVTMANFNSGAIKPINLGVTASGWYRNLLVQPVAYTTQNITDLSTL
jgi:hypothetical protein